MDEEFIFHEALARSTGYERKKFLDEVCSGQPALRAAVEALLAADDEPGEFLGGPMLAVGDSEPEGGESGPSGETWTHDGTADPENRRLDPLPPPGSPTKAPARIGRYEVRRLLGRGGMGAVYLAHDPELDRSVALKVPELLSGGAEERFLREARAAAAVSHPNLCPVYDAGRSDGVLYLAMAYVEGSTLTELLKQASPLAPARAATLAIGIARGMAEAHRHGIVHRDLKPGNVLLGRLGEPVVTDFGLALREAGSGPSENAKRAVEFEPRLTHPGILMGTPTYMPPEQACGDLEQVGPASDIYSLGAILYELVTGRPPFRADTTAQLMRKIVSEPAPSPSGLRPGIPAKFDVICAKALAKDPAERFASMDDFADALEPCAAGGNHFRRRALAGAAAAFVLAVVAGIVFYVKTDNGTIEIRLNDPAANVEVSVDGNEVQLTENHRVTKLRAGTHALVVEGPDFETETQVFKVIRGNNPAVEVRLTPKANASAKAGPDQDRPAAPNSDRARLAVLLAQGKKLIAAVRYQDLEAVAEAALKIDAASPGALAMRATVRSLVHNDRAGALAAVDLALKLNPETVQALVSRAGINGISGSFDEAIADLTIAIRLDPRHPSATWLRGQAYLDKKEYRQALVDSTQAIKLGHRWPDPFDVRSGALAFLGDYKNALADLDKAIEILPNPRYYVQRSALYAKLGDAQQAGADWATALKLVPNLPDRARIIISSPPQPAERKELTPEELAAFAQVIKAAEHSWSDGRLDVASEAVDAAYRIDPTSGLAVAWRAQVQFDEKHFEEAVASANEAIRLEPDLAQGYLARGAARTALNAPATGIADLTISLRIDPSNAWAWHHRGRAYMVRGQYHQGLADLTKAVEFGGRADHHATRGMCYLHLGDDTKALDDFEQAARLQPANARWRFISSLLKSRLGNPDGARRDLETAFGIDPNVADDLTLPVPMPPVKNDPELPSESKDDG